MYGSHSFETSIFQFHRPPYKKTTITWAENTEWSVLIDQLIVLQTNSQNCGHSQNYTGSFSIFVVKQPIKSMCGYLPFKPVKAYQINF